MRRIERTSRFKRDYKREARGRHRTYLDAILIPVVEALGNTHYIGLPLAFLVLLTCEAQTPVAWPASVEATSLEVSERFRTYGPSETLIAGADTIPVTLGYYCSVGGSYWADPDYDIVTAWDGLFLQVAQDSAAFVDIHSRHSFPDSILLAVDTAELRPQEYDHEIERTGGYIRIPLWSPPVVPRAFIAYDLFHARSYARLDHLEKADDNLWRHPFKDSISSFFVGRDSLMVHLLDTLSFSLDGLATAVDSVRARCPTDQSIRDWNELRGILGEEISGLRDAMLVSLATLSLTEIGDHAMESIAGYAYLAGMAPLRTTGDIRSLCALHRRVPLDSADFPGVFVSSLNHTLDIYCRPDMLNHILR